MKKFIISIYLFTLLSAVGELPQTAGQALITDTDASVAIARLLKEDKQYQEAIKQYTIILAAKPDYYEARLELAQALAGQGDTIEARKVLKAVKLDKKGQLTLAAIAETESNFQESEDIYNNLLTEDKNEHLLEFKLASVIVWQKQYKRALPIFEKLVEIYPNDTQLKRHYAQALASAGEHKKALKVWKETLN